jgi:hypothetical protein
MTTTAQHYYRIEISGGHTGSAYLYRSGLFGSLAEAERALAEELSAPEMYTFLLSDAGRFVVERYEDGSLQGATSAFPAVTLGLPGERTLAFTAEGKLEGFEIDDSDDMFDDPVLGPLVEGEVVPEVTVRLAALGLPSPHGQAAPSGGELAYVHAGDRITQPYGWFGSFDEPAFGSGRGAAAKQAAVKQGTLDAAARKRAVERKAAKK